MEPISELWVELILNGVVIAIIITLPLLIGLIFLSILRRGFQKDREKFETKVIGLLEEIRDTQIGRKSSDH